MENSDHQRSCSTCTSLIETLKTKPTLIMFTTDWPNSLITCKNTLSPPCASDMKDCSEPSSTCKSSRKTQQTPPSCQKTFPTSIKLYYYLVSISSSEKPDKPSDNPKESTNKVTSLPSPQEKISNKSSFHSRIVSRD